MVGQTSSRKYRRPILWGPLMIYIDPFWLHDERFGVYFFPRQPWLILFGYTSVSTKWPANLEWPAKPLIFSLASQSFHHLWQKKWIQISQLNVLLWTRWMLPMTNKPSLTMIRMIPILLWPISNCPAEKKKNRIPSCYFCFPESLRCFTVYYCYTKIHIFPWAPLWGFLLLHTLHWGSSRSASLNQKLFLLVLYPGFTMKFCEFTMDSLGFLRIGVALHHRIIESNLAGSSIVNHPASDKGVPPWRVGKPQISILHDPSRGITHWSDGPIPTIWLVGFSPRLWKNMSQSVTGWWNSQYH